VSRTRRPEPSADGAPPDSLLPAGARGFLWTGGAQIASQSLHIAIRLVLANLLLPEAFGLVAMAMAFLGVTALVTDLGLGNALVQRSGITDAHRSAAFWITCAGSLALFLLFFGAAPLVGWFYREPAVVPVLRALSVTLLLAAPETTFAALLMRDLDFRSLGLRQLLATAVAGGAGIVAAAGGAGVWALVVHAVLQPAISSTWLALRVGWWPGRTTRAAARELWAFGRWVAGARLLNYANRNADNLLIGRFLGAASLGLYAFSYQAVLLPLMYVARPVATVSFPSFAQIQHDLERCASVYRRTVELITLVAWPIAALAAVSAPATIPVLVGEEWVGAVPIFQILSGVAALHAFMNLSSPLLDALGRSRVGFLWTGFNLPVNLAGFVIGLRWGAEGVAAGLLAAACLLVPVHIWMVTRFVPLSPAPLVSILARGSLLWAGAAAGWHLAAPLLRPEAGLLRLGLTGLCSLAACAGVSALAFRDAWRLLLRAFHTLPGQRGEAT
jgi:O-antigen/teichoic acid export membrane protein